VPEYALGIRGGMYRGARRKPTDLLTLRAKIVKASEIGREAAARLAS
jgi:hypothetical protein